MWCVCQMIVQKGWQLLLRPSIIFVFIVGVMSSYVLVLVVGSDLSICQQHISLNCATNILILILNLPANVGQS
jgi:hypothetical protein